MKRAIGKWISTTCCACFARRIVRGSKGFKGYSFQQRSRWFCRSDSKAEGWRTRVSAPQECLPHIHCTTTLAVIFGWMEQKYVYVPGLLNVKLNFSSVS